MAKSTRFGRLLNEGITSVSKRQTVKKQHVEAELGERTGYSLHNVHHWQRGNIPDDATTLREIVAYCVANGRVDKQWAQSLLNAAQFDAVTQLLNELFTEQPRIFISYQLGLEPDETLALELARALSRRAIVFFEQVATINADWVRQVQAELARADYFVVLLSAESLTDEVLLLELKRAAALHAEHGTPQLLPIRVNYRAPFGGVVGSLLDGVAWGFWDADADELIGEVLAVLDGEGLPLDSAEKKAALLQAQPAAAAPPKPSAEPPMGAIPLDSAFYIKRQSDQIAHTALQSSGATIVIKGARQIGKTSLLIRLMQASTRCAFIDFQLLQPAHSDADAFYRLFARLLSLRLGVPDGTDLYWSLPLPNPVRLTEYVANLLNDAPLMLAMDEVETIFETPFRTDFFGMLRSWHSQRAIDPRWRKLDMVLVTSTEPYFFIDNLNQSPFNVGEVIELGGFSAENTADLNRRHHNPFTPTQLTQLQTLLSGHPFLTRRALYLVSQGRATTNDILSDATVEGVFGDHLRRLSLMLYERPALATAMRQVIEEQHCDDKIALFGLRGAGLVREAAGRVVPVNQLYARFFENAISL